MGHEGMERLEAAWETQEDPEMQARLEDAISRLHLKEVARELLEWRKDGGKDLLRGWYLVSRYRCLWEAKKPSSLSGQPHSSSGCLSRRIFGRVLRCYTLATCFVLPLPRRGPPRN